MPQKYERDFRATLIGLTLAISWAVPVLALADDPAHETPFPCAHEGASQFDFWLGSWDLSWGEDGKGTNDITRVLDDCVIREEFDGRPGMKLRGVSLSTYDPASNSWRQTWVDNSGSYLDFVGAWRGDRMVLEREVERDGVTIRQRMVWHDIKKDTFTWDWQRSQDDGVTWETLWQIRYTRSRQKTR